MLRSMLRLPRHRDPTTSPTLLRSLLATLVAIATLVQPPAAIAQDYPNRPVKLIVPFDAGGPADVFARFLAQRLQETMGQPFVVEDRPGAGSLIGTEAVAKSAPDGYTLLVMSNTHTVNESLVPGKPFALMKDFVPVAPINYSDLVLVVNPNVPVDNLADFIKLAKSKPNGLNYASSGTGTPYHMAGELFKAMAGVEIVHVPYKGSGGARTGVLGGQVEMMFDAVTVMNEHVKAGKVRALATSGKVRSPVMPNVPTLAEAGVPGYEAVIWLGLIAPKNTPPAIVDRLNAEITKIVARPDVQAEWAKQGAVPMTMTPQAFERYLADDIVKWERIVKVSGARADR
jgi:tripartite-type tricarboxylate transporter receptor subunit TctC